MAPSERSFLSEIELAFSELVVEDGYRLRPLTLPPRTINAANARSYSAVELFVRRVTSADYHFELTEANVEQVTALCRALDGVPLALEIAAARVPSLGLTAVTEDLALSSGLLAAQKRQTSARHRTLGDAMQWSYQLLDSVEQAVFQELAVFPADFTVAAAERIVSTKLERPGRLVDVLCSLVEKSLITLQAGTQPIRYRYLSMLRAYALEQLANRTAAVTERHARFVEQLTSQAQQDWTSLPTTQWKRQYEHHIDDIRAALNWSLSDSKRRASGLLILANSAPFWIQLSLCFAASSSLARYRARSPHILDGALSTHSRQSRWSALPSCLRACSRVSSRPSRVAAHEAYVVCRRAVAHPSP